MVGRFGIAERDDFVSKLGLALVNVFREVREVTLKADYVRL
jgi:hypothetical protein